MTPRLEFAIQAALQAGEITKKYFLGAKQFDRKSDDSPVTLADREAERMLRDAILREFPDDQILGEEEGITLGSGGRWLIDPIDGTKSFLAGVPLYSTLLSYEFEGETQLGVCVVPALGEIVYASRGKGAFWNGNRCYVSQVSRLEDAIFSCGGLQSMDKSGRMNSFLNHFGPSLALRGWSDAYGHLLVATGRIEGMIDPIVQEWDIHALELILSEAGGAMTDFSGQKRAGTEAISSNGNFDDLIREAFES